MGVISIVQFAICFKQYSSYRLSEREVKCLEMHKFYCVGVRMLVHYTKSLLHWRSLAPLTDATFFCLEAVNIFQINLSLFSLAQHYISNVILGESILFVLYVCTVADSTIKITFLMLFLCGEYQFSLPYLTEYSSSFTATDYAHDRRSLKIIAYNVLFLNLNFKNIAYFLNCTNHK